MVNTAHITTRLVLDDLKKHEKEVELYCKMSNIPYHSLYKLGMNPIIINGLDIVRGNFFNNSIERAEITTKMYRIYQKFIPQITLFDFVQALGQDSKWYHEWD